MTLDSHKQRNPNPQIKKYKPYPQIIKQKRKHQRNHLKGGSLRFIETIKDEET